MIGWIIFGSIILFLFLIGIIIFCWLLLYQFEPSISLVPQILVIGIAGIAIYLIVGYKFKTTILEMEKKGAKL